jgi:hypothetical protein
MKFGQKVKAYPNIEEPRVGFIVNPEPDAEGKYGIQVGADLYGLAHEPHAEKGNRGGTFCEI